MPTSVTKRAVQASRYRGSLAVAAVVCFAAFGSGIVNSAELVAVPDLGVRIANGFRISLFADNDLANDVFAMTLNARGEVVVTSRGYIRTLQDTNHDGRADIAKPFAETRSGGMGLCFDGNDLYFAGDGGLWRYRDANGDGAADGPPEKLMSAQSGEHGGHAIRKGPDGLLYFIGGNDAGFTSNHITATNSPVKTPQAGAFLRIAPATGATEVIAHGFRNPYDFDFNPQGDLFAYDSDCERDFFLPWYTPTRLYHVGYGSHHSWVLTGYLRSWNRPDHYVDAVDILADLGRSSPTGVAAYRHTQFPDRYRGGLFLCDWTFGKIWFCPLKQDGPTYRSEPEVFIEPIGTHGFAPTDVAVAPDGALFISIGGRKTRGAVYRIAFTSPPSRLMASGSEAESELQAVLDAPQPLEAWSRARWEPVARRLGKQVFRDTLLNEHLMPSARIRAIEVLTELFDGVPPTRAPLVAKAASPQIRSRLAWSLGRAPFEDLGYVLPQLALDGHPMVRRSALESMTDRMSFMTAGDLLKVLPQNFAYRDERVREAAARLAAILSDSAWTNLVADVEKQSIQARLTLVLATMWRSPGQEVHPGALIAATSILETVQDPRLRLQAIRLIMLALGDWQIAKPSVEVYSGYELTTSLIDRAVIAERIGAAVRLLFPSGESLLDLESSRLLAMIEDPAPESLQAIGMSFSERTSATADFHYLTVLSRLRAPRPPEPAPRVAHVVLDLERKLAGQEQRTKQTWSTRLAEVVAALCSRDPHLAPALLQHTNFARPSHVSLASAVGAEHREPAARLFLSAVRADAQFIWTGPLVELLGTLSAEDVRTLFREQWNNLAVRDHIALQLARTPEPADAERFLDALKSTQMDAVRASLGALKQLPADRRPEQLAPLIRLLRRLMTEPNEASARQFTIDLINRASGKQFVIQETRKDALRPAYEPVFTWFEQTHPALAKAVNDSGEDDPLLWQRTLAAVKWSEGNAQRGAVAFRARACESCHNGPTALGPDLRGAAARFSTDDLFGAIVFPSRDIAPAYRTTRFELRDGQSHTGMVVFESADGVIIQTGAASTVRLADADILSRTPGTLSLMPSALLAGATPGELADLYAYLKALTP